MIPTNLSQALRESMKRRVAHHFKTMLMLAGIADDLHRSLVMAKPTLQENKQQPKIARV